MSVATGDPAQFLSRPAPEPRMTITVPLARLQGLTRRSLAGAASPPLAAASKPSPGAPGLATGRGANRAAFAFNRAHRAKLNQIVCIELMVAEQAGRVSLLFGASSAGR